MEEIIGIIQKSTHLSDEAKAHILQWLTEEKYSYYQDDVLTLIRANEWQFLEDSFFRVLPFGTGGRRGTVGVGSSRMNRVTVGETVQALCDYLRIMHADSEVKGVAIAYDSRLTSKEFAVFSAEVLAGNGYKVYLFDGPRSTPELSFTVRHLALQAGIVITASHNPSSDNGIKLYWEDGGQLVPPHDGNILEHAENAATIHTLAYADAVQQGLIVTIGSEVDEAYFTAVTDVLQEKNRQLKVAYSPLHGTGITSVYPTLQRAGFEVALYEEQATLDGHFTNVTNNIPNPELPIANDKLCIFASSVHADIAISNDPDADRYCVMVASGGTMTQLNGNQAAVLMTDYLLMKAKEKGELTNKHFISSTIVTTDMLLALADFYGVRAVSNLLVGFKYIGEQIHLRCDKGNEVFVCGGEESYGGIVGTYARDKDGAAPSLILAELAATLKQEGKTLLDKLDELYTQHGYFYEVLDSVFFYGAEGDAKMRSFMHHVRSQPPTDLAGLRVVRTRDYIGAEEIAGKSEDVLRFECSDDGRTRITMRPSGTEPKLKLYVQTYSAVQNNDLRQTKINVEAQAEKLHAALKAMVDDFNE